MKLLTHRLLIRTLKETDYPAFEPTLNDVQKACFGSGEGFLRWLISQYEAMDIVNGLISLGIFDRENGTFYGSVGVGKHDDLCEPEIFYYLLSTYRGYGYATEATKAVTEWALSQYGIPYLIGTVDVENIKSQHVLEHCGYQYIDTRELLVHVLNTKHTFRYYRYYRYYAK